MGMQQQPGTGSKQDNTPKTAKDQNMNKKKSDQGSCGSCSSDKTDADKMATDRMEDEGDVASSFKKDKKRAMTPASQSSRA